MTTAEWRVRGECRTDPDLFFQADSASVAQAKAACHRCPVLTQCEAWALSLASEIDQHGIIAGLTPAQRERLRHPDRSRRLSGRPQEGAAA